MAKCYKLISTINYEKLTSPTATVCVAAAELETDVVDTLIVETDWAIAPTTAPDR